MRTKVGGKKIYCWFFVGRVLELEYEYVRVRVTWIWTDADRFNFLIFIPKLCCRNWYIILKFQIYILCTVPKHPWDH